MALLPPTKITGTDAPYWTTAASSSRVQVSPFEAKALFLVGVVRNLVEGAKVCHTTGYHASAYASVLAAAESLGRCRSGTTDDLKRGLQFLADGTDDPNAVVELDGRRYSVEDCIDLRNFTDHGFSGRKRPPLMTDKMVPALAALIRGALDRFWADLVNVPSARAALADAKMLPLFLQPSGEPIFINDAYPFGASGQPGQGLA